MAADSSFSSNVGNMINIYEKDFESCNMIFENIKSIYTAINYDIKTQKCNTMSDISDFYGDLLINLKGLELFEIDKNQYIDEYKIKLSEYQRVIDRFSQKYDDVKQDFFKLEKNFLEKQQYQEVTQSHEELNEESYFDSEDVQSETSSVCSASVNKFDFYYKKKENFTALICQGCQTNINSETYIHPYNKNETIPFHIRKSCLKKGNCLPEKLDNIRCHVGKLLKNHDELRELISCGFFYNRIIGYRPQNPQKMNMPRKDLNISEKIKLIETIDKQPPGTSFRQLDKITGVSKSTISRILEGSTKKPKKNQQNTTADQASDGDKKFIFNGQPFTCRRLIHEEKCRGCLNRIKKEDFSLVHKERVPRLDLDSTPLISQYYHLEKKCLMSRGFTVKYLSTSACQVYFLTTDSTLKLEVSITRCGFDGKNIYFNMTESDNVKGFQSVQDDKNFPDDISTTSDVSYSSLNQSLSEFSYHRKNGENSMIVVCQGCQSNIDSDTFLTCINRNRKISFHIKKSCLKSGDVLPENFETTICRVGRLLRNHDDLKELIACGFFYNKIIGFRPSNSFLKDNNKSSKTLPSGDQTSCDDKKFIFNDEPFICRRTLHNQKCKGCLNFVKKEDFLLAHKEQTSTSLIYHYQHYHLEKKCLISRGFTVAYLSNSKCNIFPSNNENNKLLTDNQCSVLSGAELQQIENSVKLCGFSAENILWKNIEDSKEFESVFQPKRREEDFKFFVDRCKTSQSHCFGCAFIFKPNDYYLRYSTNIFEECDAKYFHIRAYCLEKYFTKDRIRKIACVLNKSVDVKSDEIFNCGISIILQSQIEICPSDKKNANKPYRFGNNYNNRAQSPRNVEKKLSTNFEMPMKVDVETCNDDMLKCLVCHSPIDVGAYLLRIKSKRNSGKSVIHLETSCVKNLDLSRSEIDQSQTKLKVYLSDEAASILKECGFRKFQNR